jgi:ribosome-associated translation inhibitor RaiA
MAAKQTMKLTIKHHDIRSTHELDSLVEQELLSMASRVCIEEAVVALGCQRERSPSCHAQIRIITPGPDLQVEGTDHTVAAAFRQALIDLGRKLDTRHRNRARQRRSPRPSQVHSRTAWARQAA